MDQFLQHNKYMSKEFHKYDTDHPHTTKDSYERIKSVLDGHIAELADVVRALEPIANRAQGYIEVRDKAIKEEIATKERLKHKEQADSAMAILKTPPSLDYESYFKAFNEAESSLTWFRNNPNLPLAQDFIVSLGSAKQDAIASCREEFENLLKNVQSYPNPVISEGSFATTFNLIDTAIKSLSDFNTSVNQVGAQLPASLPETRFFPGLAAKYDELAALGSYLSKIDYTLKTIYLQSRVNHIRTALDTATTKCQEGIAYKRHSYWGIKRLFSILWLLRDEKALMKSIFGSLDGFNLLIEGPIASFKQIFEELSVLCRKAPLKYFFAFADFCLYFTFSMPNLKEYISMGTLYDIYSIGKSTNDFLISNFITQFMDLEKTLSKGAVHEYSANIITVITKLSPYTAMIESLINADNAVFKKKEDRKTTHVTIKKFLVDFLNTYRNFLHELILLYPSNIQEIMELNNLSYISKSLKSCDLLPMYTESILEIDTECKRLLAAHTVKVYKPIVARLDMPQYKQLIERNAEFLNNESGAAHTQNVKNFITAQLTQFKNDITQLRANISYQIVDPSIRTALRNAILKTLIVDGYEEFCLYANDMSLIKLWINNAMPYTMETLVSIINNLVYPKE